MKKQSSIANLPSAATPEAQIVSVWDTHLKHRPVGVQMEQNPLPRVSLTIEFHSQERTMFLKILAVSTVTLGIATSALAEPLTLRVSPKGPRVITVYSAVEDHSKDAILADGTINTAQAFTGTTNRTPIRIQCDSNPTTSVMRTNTFDAAPLSDCP